MGLTAQEKTPDKSKEHTGPQSRLTTDMSCSHMEVYMLISRNDRKRERDVCFSLFVWYLFLAQLKP